MHRGAELVRIGMQRKCAKPSPGPEPADNRRQLGVAGSSVTPSLLPGVRSIGDSAMPRCVGRNEDCVEVEGSDRQLLGDPL
eukprot:8310909-Pyramimonas_sp.AAC.2